MMELQFRLVPHPAQSSRWTEDEWELASPRELGLPSLQLALALQPEALRVRPGESPPAPPRWRPRPAQAWRQRGRAVNLSLPASNRLLRGCRPGGRAILLRHPDLSPAAPPRAAGGWPAARRHGEYADIRAPAA